MSVKIEHHVVNAHGDHTNERLNEVMEIAQKKVMHSVRFHLRAWVSNFNALRENSKKVVVDWVEQEAKNLDVRVEKACWQLHRPVSWLTKQIEHLDEVRLQHKEKSVKAEQEQKLQDMEIPRLLDEGGCVGKDCG